MKNEKWKIIYGKLKGSLWWSAILFIYHLECAGPAAFSKALSFTPPHYK